MLPHAATIRAQYTIHRVSKHQITSHYLLFIPSESWHSHLHHAFDLGLPTGRPTRNTIDLHARYQNLPWLLQYCVEMARALRITRFLAPMAGPRTECHFALRYDGWVGRRRQHDPSFVIVSSLFSSICVIGVLIICRFVFQTSQSLYNGVCRYMASF